MHKSKKMGVGAKNKRGSKKIKEQAQMQYFFLNTI
jgi:hypothetical protein